MLARTTSRTLVRSTSSSLLPAASSGAVGSSSTTPARFFSKSEKHQGAVAPAETRVPVISYKDGVRTESIIKVADPPVVRPPGADVKKVAMRLDPAVREKLTPTLKKFTLYGKVAIITGGGRGLGYNMAQAMAESGAKGIAILDLLKDEGEVAARELAEQTGVDVRFYPVDITKELAVQKSVQDIMNHYGRIDVLINSAGIADSNMPAETYNIDRFRHLININLTGNFIVAQAVAQEMIRTKTRGSIINIASMSGSIVNYPQEQSCYNASKSGVIQLTKSLAAEWAKYGIRVNAISPGYMDTALNRVPELDAQKKMWVERTPQGRLGNVDELNNLALLLASDASTFMTGSNVIIDGGYTLW